MADPVSAPVATPPAPAPAPAPAPSPAPSPTPAPAPSTSKFIPGDFSDLDSLGDDPAPTPAPTPAPSPSPKTTAPAPTTPAEPELDVDGVPKFKINKDLRKWAADQGKSAKENTAKATRLEARIKELEAQSGKTQESVQLTEQLATLNKKIEDYESQLRLTHYERSEEYKSKFQVPIERAVEAAHREMGELEVETTDADTGQKSYRVAVPADFNRIYQLPLGEATRQAKAAFGDAASIVLDHRREIRKLSEAADLAVKEYQTKGSELEKQNTVKSSQEREAAASMWRTVNEDISKKYPKWFAPDENDKEGNALLEKGFQFVDSIIGDNRSKLTLQERILGDAHLRNRAAGFLRLASKVKSLTAQLAEKDKVIAEMRGSAPGGTRDGSGEPTNKEIKSWVDAFEANDKLK